MNTKIQLFTMNITEWPRMEQYFEAMALKGWLITKVWGGFAIFKKIEPADLTFSVAVYPEARSFESFDKTKSAAYIDQEKENGWQLAATKHNLQVFYRRKRQEGPALRRGFQVGNIHSHLQLETFSFITLLVLNLFNAYRMFPPSHTMFYSNLSLALVFWMPLLFLFFAVRLLANAMFLYRESKGLSLENYHEYPAGLNRFLNIAAYYIAGSVILAMFGSIAIDTFDSGRQMYLSMLPFIAAMGIGLGLRKYFTGKNWDGVQKTLAVIVLVVIVVSATSFFTMNRMLDRREENLPQGQIALTVKDLAPEGQPDYQSYRSSSSLLVPEYYRYHESLSGEIAVNTEVAKTRSERVAAYLYNLHQREMDKYNYQIISAAEDFPKYDEVTYAIQFYRSQDGSEGGTLMIRDGLNVISLSVNQDLNDQQVKALLADKISEIQAN